MRSQQEALDDAQHHAAELVDALQDADASEQMINIAELNYLVVKKEVAMMEESD